MRRECRECFPHHRGLAIPTCITARASRTCRDACRDRYLAVSFEIGGGENVPGIPGACAKQNFTYLVRGPLTSHSYPLFSFSTPRHKCRNGQLITQVPIINQCHSGITYTNNGLEPPSPLCISSYYQSRYYQPKIAKSIRDEDVQACFCNFHYYQCPKYINSPISPRQRNSRCTHETINSHILLAVSWTPTIWRSEHGSWLIETAWFHW